MRLALPGRSMRREIGTGQAENSLECTPAESGASGRRTRGNWFGWFGVKQPPRSQIFQPGVRHKPECTTAHLTATTTDQLSFPQLCKMVIAFGLLKPKVLNQFIICDAVMGVVVGKCDKHLFANVVQFVLFWTRIARCNCSHFCAMFLLNLRHRLRMALL